MQPPAPGSGKSYFLRRLLREVILAEAPLAGVDPRLERRRRLALAAGLAGIAIATLVLAGVWTASYLANRDRVVAAGATAVALNAELAAQASLRVGDEARMLALLDRLRSLPGSVDAGGGLLRVGFGQGEKLTAQATRAYRDALRELLLSHAVYSLERALKASPAREPLEAYLSLYERAPDGRVIGAALAQLWNLPPAARDTLPVHLRTALEDLPLALPDSRDDGLVAAARRKIGAGARL